MLFLPCSLKTGKKLISWEIRSLKVLEGVGAFLRAHAFGRFEIELKSFPGLQPVLLPIAKSWKVLLMPMPCEAQPHTSNNSFLSALSRAGGWNCCLVTGDGSGDPTGGRKMLHQDVEGQQEAGVSSQKGLKPSKSHNTKTHEIPHFDSLTLNFYCKCAQENLP